jgi:hypothetical protein
LITPTVGETSFPRGAGGVGQVVEDLPSKCEALNSFKPQHLKKNYFPVELKYLRVGGTVRFQSEILTGKV